MMPIFFGKLKKFLSQELVIERIEITETFKRSLGPMFRRSEHFGVRIELHTRVRCAVRLSRWIVWIQIFFLLIASSWEGLPADVHP